jgi:hypothetical protein
MWAKLLQWMPAIASNLPRVIDAAKAAWQAFRHAPAPKDAPTEPTE